MRTAPIAVALCIVGLVACGDDSTPAADSMPTQTSAPATSRPPVTVNTAADEIATGPDDVVISVAYEGGFVTPQMVFARTPIAMVTGDGRALTTGPVPEIFPGPLLPNVLERSITPAGTQELLGLADDLGLLVEVDYPRDDLIADAPDTVVTITVAGTTYRHQAYALGIDTEDDPARRALGEFVAAMTDLPSSVGADELGAEEPYVSEEYLIQATPVNPASMADDVAPTIETWPEGSSVRLADADVCAEVPAADVEPLFVDATALTFFTDADITYQVTPVPQVPGREC